MEFASEEASWWSLSVSERKTVFFVVVVLCPLPTSLTLFCVSAVSLLSGGLWTGSATGFLNKHEHR